MGGASYYLIYLVLCTHLVRNKYFFCTTCDSFTYICLNGVLSTFYVLCLGYVRSVLFSGAPVGFYLHIKSSVGERTSSADDSVYTAKFAFSIIYLNY